MRKILDIKESSIYLYEDERKVGYVTSSDTNLQISEFVKKAKDAEIVIFADAISLSMAKIITQIFPTMSIYKYKKTEKYGGHGRGAAPVHFGEVDMMGISNIPQNINYKFFISTSWAYEIFGKGDRVNDRLKELGINICPVFWESSDFQNND